MGRFDDQTQFGNQDRGFRSDEVRGPTREEWAGQAKSSSTEREESAGGAGGYGNSQNPAWAGQSANLESDVAGRGSYGAEGTEGTSGYGRYGKDGGEGQMVASPSESDQPQREDFGFGTRHWGQCEFKGDDAKDQAPERHSTGEADRSDDELRDAIREALSTADTATGVEVAVNDGVVSLGGTVEDRRARRRVEEIVDGVSGIRDIENHLRTKTYVARTEAADQLRRGETSPSELHS